MTEAPRKPDSFFRALTSFSFSCAGDGILFAFVPLYAKHAMFNPVDFTNIMVMRTLPVFFLSIPAGILTDKITPHRIIPLIFVGRVLALLFLLAQLQAGAVGTLAFSIAVVSLGICEIVYDTCYFATIPRVANGRDLVKVNSWFRSSEVASNLAVGGTIAGLLFATSPSACLAISLLLYLISVLFIFRVDLTMPIPHGAGTTGWISDFGSGFKLIFSNRTYLIYTVISAVQNLTFYALASTLILYVKDHLGKGDTHFALANQGPSVGLLLGSLYLSAHRSAGRRENTYQLALALSLAAYLVIGTLDNYWSLILSLGVVGITWSICSAWNSSFAQSHFALPDQGKIRGTSRLLTAGCMPIGTAIGGFLGFHLGLTPSHLVIAAISAVPFILYTLFKPR